MRTLLLLACLLTAPIFTTGIYGFDNSSIDPVQEQDSIIEFSFYPNPASDWINFNSTKTVSKIEVYNLLGQKVRSFQDNLLANQRVGIGDLETGNYLLKVYFEKETQIFRLIKN